MPRDCRSALSGVESPGIRAFEKRSRLVGFLTDASLVCYGPSRTLLCCIQDGWGTRIRTWDPLLPKQVR